MPDARHPTDYQGPPRDPEAVIRAALSDPELMRQTISSYEDQLRGIPGVPWREVRDAAASRDARAKPRRSA